MWIELEITPEQEKELLRWAYYAKITGNWFPESDAFQAVVVRIFRKIQEERALEQLCD